MIKHHFVRKGCDGKSSEIAIFLLQFFAIEHHFVRNGCDGNPEIAILPQFLVIEPHFVRKGCAGRFATRNFTSVFGDQTSFRAKGLRRTLCNSQFYLSFWRSNLFSCEKVAPGRRNHNFTSVFGDRTSFRAKGLHFVLSRWHLHFVLSRWHFPAPSREK